MIRIDINSRPNVFLACQPSPEPNETAPCLLTPTQLEVFRRMFHGGREYDYTPLVTEVPNPHIGSKYELAKEPVQFNSKLNLIGFLNRLNERLKEAQIPAKGFYLKGGAVQAILTGEMKKLSDLDLRIVVGDDCNWDGLERCFLEVLDEAVGISIVRTSDRNRIDTTYWYQGKEIGRVRAHKSYAALPFCRGKGALGMLQKVKGEGSDYMLYSLPTRGESIDLQFVKKSDVNCLTSSDSLQIDLTPLVLSPTQPVEAISYLAVDGYDAKEACLLNEQRQFKIDPARIGKIRFGLRAYAKTVTKGRCPTDLRAERELYQLFLNEMREGSFDSYLTRYLDDHFVDNNNGRILCLLNFLAIISRCKNGGDDQIRYIEMVINRSLCTALGVDIQEIKEEELSRFTLAAPEYLHMLSEEKIPAGGMVFFRAREVKRPDEINPQNWLFAEAPKGALRDGADLLQNRLFLALVKLYPHDERDLPTFLHKASTTVKVDRGVQAPTPSVTREGEPSPVPSEHEPGAAPVRLPRSYAELTRGSNRALPQQELKVEERGPTPPPLGVLEAVKRNCFELSVDHGHALLDYLGSASPREIEREKGSLLGTISRMLLFLRDRRENLLAWQIFRTACNFDPILREIRFEEFFDPRLVDAAPPTEVISLYGRYATQVKRPFESGLRLAMNVTYKDPEAVRELLSLSRLSAMDPNMPLFLAFLKERKIIQGVSLLPLSWVNEYLPRVEGKKDLKALYEEMKPKLEEAKGEDQLAALRLYNQFMDRLLSGDPSIQSGLVQMVSILSRSPVETNLDCKMGVMQLAAKPDLLIKHLEMDELRTFLKVLRDSGLNGRYAECERVLSRRVGDAAPLAPKKKKKKPKDAPIEKAKGGAAKPILAHLEAKRFNAKETLSFIELSRDQKEVTDDEVKRGFDALVKMVDEQLLQLRVEDLNHYCDALKSLESQRRVLPPSFYWFSLSLLDSGIRSGEGSSSPNANRMVEVISSGIKKKILGPDHSEKLINNLLHIFSRPGGIEKVRSLLSLIELRFEGSEYLKFVCDLFSCEHFRGMTVKSPHFRELIGCMFSYFDKLFKVVGGKSPLLPGHKDFLLYRPFFQLSEFSLILRRAEICKHDDPLMQQIFSVMERIIAIAKKQKDQITMGRLMGLGNQFLHLGVLGVAEESRQTIFGLLGIPTGLTKDEMNKESLPTLFNAARVVNSRLALQILIHAREKFSNIDELVTRDIIAKDRNLRGELVAHYGNAKNWLEVARLEIFLGHPDKAFEALSRISEEGKEPALLSIYRSRAFAQFGDQEKELEQMAEYVRRLIFLKDGIVGVEDVDIRHEQLKAMDAASRALYFQLRQGVAGGDPKNNYLFGISMMDVALQYDDPAKKGVALSGARGHLYHAVKALEADLPTLARPIAFPPPPKPLQS